MKRLVAKRKLNHGCIQCNNPILKGQVYYRKRTVFREDGRVKVYVVWGNSILGKGGLVYGQKL